MLHKIFRRAKNYSSKYERQLYEGFIAKKYPFYFTITSYYSAIYAYKKYGKGIRLSFEENSSRGNIRVYKEYNQEEGKYDFEATINFENRDDTLDGFWISKKGERKTFKAKRK